MTHELNPPFRRHADEAALQRALVVKAGLRWLAGRIDALRYRLEVRAALRELQALDGRMLADLGINRGDIEAAVEGRLDQDVTLISRRAG